MATQTAPPNKEPDLHPVTDADLDIAEFTLREPVIDEEAAILNPELARQRGLITEATRREILANPEAREIAKGWTQRPLSELLPQQSLAELSGRSPRIQRLVGRMNAFGTYIGLEPVPDDVLRPDITYASPLVSRSGAEQMIARVHGLKGKEGVSPEKYRREQVRTRESLARLTQGVCHAEKRLVAQRYIDARNMVLLGFAAEMQDASPQEVERDDDLVTQILPSGTKLVMARDVYEDAPELLNPKQWQSRTQLKDRVHAVVIGGQTYVMKERKTPRHTDTKEDGHIDGLTSAEEFEVARHFSELGTIEKDGMRLRWERPLGYVEFPNGYQFCLFTHEPGLSANPFDAITSLQQEINRAGVNYQDEFMETSQRAKELYREHANDLDIDTAANDSESKLAADELSYGEFAGILASGLTYRAVEELGNKIDEEGYKNGDQDGFGFRVLRGPDEKPQLEIVGFDFEYYQHAPGDAKEQQDYSTRRQNNGSRARELVTRLFPWESISRPITEAAAYAVLERLGYGIFKES